VSGGAVVIIIGGGTQQNRTVETVEQEGGPLKIRLTLEDGETPAQALRRAADTLDGNVV
jgi:GTP cyclohydrolase III